MTILTLFEPWWQFAFALLIGALIGLEREFYQQKKERPDFAGIRTFSLISLMGSVAAFLANTYGINLAVLALGGLILLSAVSFAGSLFQSKSGPGITTEIAAILTYLFGVLVMGDHPTVAIALAVVTSLIMSLKGSLHNAIRNMSSDDIRITLQFALVAAVILPLLPNRALDPYGLLNPFQIWLMVVLISSIGFSGYIVMNLLGPSHGIDIIGILGGLASSTATTISYSSASRETPEMSTYYARAVIMASSIMFPRVLILSLIIHPGLAQKVALPLAVMFLTGLVSIILLMRKDRTERQEDISRFKIKNPLELSTAIKFGLLFALVLIIMEAARNMLGTSGIYLTSVITGLTDVNAITLSIARLSSSAQINLQVAGTAVLIASLMNTVAKGIISYTTGSKQLRRVVIRTLAAILLTGLLSGAYSFFIM